MALPAQDMLHQQKRIQIFNDFRKKILKCKSYAEAEENLAPRLRKMAIQHLQNGKGPYAHSFRAGVREDTAREVLKSVKGNFKNFLKLQSKSGRDATFAEALALGESLGVNVVITSLGTHEVKVTRYDAPFSGAPTIHLEYYPETKQWKYSEATISNNSSLYNAFAEFITDVVFGFRSKKEDAELDTPEQIKRNLFSQVLTQLTSETGALTLQEKLYLKKLVYDFVEVQLKNHQPTGDIRDILVKLMRHVLRENTWGEIEDFYAAKDIADLAKKAQDWAKSKRNKNGVILLYKEDPDRHPTWFVCGKSVQNGAIGERIHPLSKLGRYLATKSPFDISDQDTREMRDAIVDYLDNAAEKRNGQNLGDIEDAILVSDPGDCANKVQRWLAKQPPQNGMLLVYTNYANTTGKWIVYARKVNGKVVSQDAYVIPAVQELLQSKFPDDVSYEERFEVQAQVATYLCRRGNRRGILQNLTTALAAANRVTSKLHATKAAAIHQNQPSGVSTSQQGHATKQRASQNLPQQGVVEDKVTARTLCLDDVTSDDAANSSDIVFSSDAADDGDMDFTSGKTKHQDNVSFSVAEPWCDAQPQIAIESVVAPTITQPPLINREAMAISPIGDVSHQVTGVAGSGSTEYQNPVIGEDCAGVVHDAIPVGEAAEFDSLGSSDAAEDENLLSQSSASTPSSTSSDDSGILLVLEDRGNIPMTTTELQDLRRDVETLPEDVLEQRISEFTSCDINLQEMLDEVERQFSRGNSPAEKTGDASEPTGKTQPSFKDKLVSLANKIMMGALPVMAASFLCHGRMVVVLASGVVGAGTLVGSKLFRRKEQHQELSYTTGETLERLQQAGANISPVPTILSEPGFADGSTGSAAGSAQDSRDSSAAKNLAIKILRSLAAGALPIAGVDLLLHAGLPVLVAGSVVGGGVVVAKTLIAKVKSKSTGAMSSPRGESEFIPRSSSDKVVDMVDLESPAASEAMPEAFRLGSRP